MGGTNGTRHTDDERGPGGRGTEAGQPGYSTGFGNEHSSEAVPGALPHGRNSPQRAPLGQIGRAHV